MSSSMEPVIKTGSVIVTKYVHPSTLNTGDIITFVNPVSKEREYVTHRIMAAEDENGFIRITTKGDNNKSSDSWILAGGGVVGKVVSQTPYAGYALSFIKSKVGIIVFILLPALFIIFDEGKFLLTYFIRKKSPSSPVTIIFFISLVFLSSFLVRKSYASLTDSVKLTHNFFAVSETDNGDDHNHCDGSIHASNRNTGFGSINKSIIKKKCKNEITINNWANVINNIFVMTSTGGNSVSSNTGEASSSAVISGDASASATVTTTMNSATFVQSVEASQSVSASSSPE